MLPVYYDPNIFNINAHAKRVCANYDIELWFLPAIKSCLQFIPFAFFQSAVKEGNVLQALFGKLIGNFLPYSPGRNEYHFLTFDKFLEHFFGIVHFLFAGYMSHSCDKNIWPIDITGKYF